MIASQAATAEQLGLSAEVQMLATEPEGLVLVTGPRGGGKSTLMSALVDLINRQRADYVISLEQQVRLVHDNRAAFVSQREVRGGQEEALQALALALREGPDVVVVDELLSPAMVPMLLNAASEGLLVLVSLAAASTTDAVQRFIEMSSPEVRKGVQSAMAESFRGAIGQVLLKKTAGGRIAAREILVATAHTARLIGDGQADQLPLALEEGRQHGMASFTRCPDRVGPFRSRRRARGVPQGPESPAIGRQSQAQRHRHDLGRSVGLVRSAGNRSTDQDWPTGPSGVHYNRRNG